MSPRAQKSKGFAVEPLPASTRRSHEEIHSDPHGQERMDVVEERLADNTRSPVPEQAMFREQFGMLLDQVGEKKKPIVQDMAGGADTKHLAAEHKISAGRVSQIRREAQNVWKRIDDPEAFERSR